MKNSSTGPQRSSSQADAKPAAGTTMTRRRFLKHGAAAVLGAGLAVGAYASLWEPNRLEVRRLTLALNGLPAAFNGLKVVQFSDMHLGFYAGAKAAVRVVEAINREKPDLICFTGDMVDGEVDALEEAILPLSGLEAAFGTYSILGNHDFYDVEKLIRMEEKAGFTVLRNSHAKLRRGGEQIAVVGLDDGIWGHPDPASTLDGLPAGMFKIVLMHEPDYGDTTAEYPVHLQLSGHSHGGQVRLPWLGEVVTPPGAKRYVQGLYHVGSRGMPLYVNRGIGMTQLPIRLLCQPELTVLTLRGADV